MTDKKKRHICEICNAPHNNITVGLCANCVKHLNDKKENPYEDKKQDVNEYLYDDSSSTDT